MKTRDSLARVAVVAAVALFGRRWRVNLSNGEDILSPLWSMNKEL
jgi:hypothetical protein